MDWIAFLDNYGVLLFGSCVAVIALVIYQIKNSRPPLSGSATVLSRKTEPAKYPAGSAYAKTNNWNYLVTFRLSDGEELELYAAQQDYDAIAEGQKGFLTWHGDNLCSFEQEENP